MRKIILAATLAHAVDILPYQGRAKTLPRYQWPADRDRDATSAAYLKAQAKRDRKNAKRLRDARRAGDA